MLARRAYRSTNLGKRCREICGSFRRKKTRATRSFQPTSTCLMRFVSREFSRRKDKAIIEGKQKSNTIQSRYRYEFVKIQKHDHIYQVHNLRISFARLIDVLCHIPVQSAVANTNDSELCINRRPFGCVVNRFNLLPPASSVSFIIIRVTVECGQPEAVFSIIFLETRQKPTAITPNMKRHCVRSSQSAVRAVIFRLIQIV